jgi:hypothetical protein
LRVEARAARKTQESRLSENSRLHWVPVGRLVCQGGGPHAGSLELEPDALAPRACRVVRTTLSAPRRSTSRCVAAASASRKVRSVTHGVAPYATLGADVEPTGDCVQEPGANRGRSIIDAPRQDPRNCMIGSHEGFPPSRCLPCPGRRRRHRLRGVAALRQRSDRRHLATSLQLDRFAERSAAGSHEVDPPRGKRAARKRRRTAGDVRTAFVGPYSPPSSSLASQFASLASTSCALPYAATMVENCETNPVTCVGSDVSVGTGA